MDGSRSNLAGLDRTCYNPFAPHGARNALSYPVISTYPRPFTATFPNDPATSTAPSQYVTRVELRKLTDPESIRDLILERE